MNQIYHLEIDGSDISVDTLVKIQKLLPTLISLKIDAFYSYKFNESISKELKSRCWTESTKELTKVYFRFLDDVEDIYFFKTLYPCMVYLKLNCIEDVDVRSLLRTVLKRNNPEFCDSLRSLCFRIPATDDKMIISLAEMIDVEGLSLDYTIKRVLDNIYLQWK